MKFMLPLLLIFIPAISAVSQDLNYSSIFGEEWKKAVDFEIENRHWIEPILEKNSISYPLAVSVIFPELVRYSALRDKMETTVLKALYVNLGEQYANFSIGVFQMKPSFAEFIREKTISVMGRKSDVSFKNKKAYDDLTAYRKSIVEDLEDPVKQLNYLIVFIKLCDKKYQSDLMDEDHRVRFLATAYNYGTGKDRTAIENMTGKRFFKTKLFKTENYSYADISLYWYSQYKSQYPEIKH
jgi:hypothetical protein